MENQQMKLDLQNLQTNQHFYAWTIGSIQEDHFFIRINDAHFNPGKYDLVGQELTDFHTLNADAIYSIGVAHIQQMEHKQRAINTQINILKTKYVSLQRLIEKQNEVIDALLVK